MTIYTQPPANRHRTRSRAVERVVERRPVVLAWLSTLAIAAVMLLSMFFVGVAKAEQHSDQLSAAAKQFSQAISTLGERDSLIAERADALSSASRNLASQGQDGFGGDKYNDTFKRVKALVGEIGGMEMEPAEPVVNAWRQIHSNIKSIDNKLATGAVTQQNTGTTSLPAKTEGALAGGVAGKISTAKNSPDSGKHVDQVEDLAERVKNSFRDIMKKRRNMAAKDWTGRLDGQLSKFDQNANKLRDTYKARGNWKPVLATMKRQATRVDRFMQKPSMKSVARQWNQLKAHLEQI